MSSRANKVSVAVGACMAALAGSSWAYSTPSIGACASATCQVIGLSNGNRSAQAVFQVLGGDLLVTVINNSLFDVTAPTDVLTALLFNLNYSDGSGVTLSPVSALMADAYGGAVDFDARTIDAPASTCEGAVDVVGATGCTASDNVGGEWAYATGGFSGQYAPFTKGIGNAGLGLFGNGNFAGPNLEGPTSVNGGQYGLTSTGDNPNTDITNNQYDPVTQSAVQFKLTITPAGGKTLDLTATGALSAAFQYGTSSDNPFITAPTPGTLALLGLGVLALGWTTRRQLRAAGSSCVPA